MAELMQIINEQASVDVREQAERDIKMGAKLIQMGELEEWLLIQDYQRTQAQNVGSNVYTYKPVSKVQDTESIRDEKLIAELQRLSLLSDTTTRENSEQHYKGWSYFERLEHKK